MGVSRVDRRRSRPQPHPPALMLNRATPSDGSAVAWPTGLPTNWPARGGALQPGAGAAHPRAACSRSRRCALGFHGPAGSAASGCRDGIRAEGVLCGVSCGFCQAPRHVYHVWHVWRDRLGRISFHPPMSHLKTAGNWSDSKQQHFFLRKHHLSLFAERFLALRWELFRKIDWVSGLVPVYMGGGLFPIDVLKKNAPFWSLPSERFTWIYFRVPWNTLLRTSTSDRHLGCYPCFNDGRVKDN